jgi:type I restriction enzyme, R subunit
VQKFMPPQKTKITESVVEQAALDRLGDLGYEVLSGLVIAPGKPAAERADYKQVFLFDRLQTKLEDLKEALRDPLLPKLLSGELRVPAAAKLVEARP